MRSYTALQNNDLIFNMYAILYTMPGIPCIYYGSECAAEGDKSDNDYKLRPCIDDVDKNKRPDLLKFIQKLNAIRRSCRALSYGSYEKCVLSNKYMCYKRELDGERIYCAFNISGEDVTVRVEEAEGTDLLTGEVRNLNDIYLPPYSVKLFRKNI